MNVLHPPSVKIIERLGSGLRQVIQQSPRPLLIARQAISPLSKALLAYDGGPRAEEALFLAAYLAKDWGISLVVLTVEEKSINTSAALARAQRYMREQGVDVELITNEGKVDEAILTVAGQHNCDFLIMGGYGSRPVIGSFRSSVTNQILRRSDMPVFICK